jgi:hypothetical protein
MRLFFLATMDFSSSRQSFVNHFAVFPPFCQFYVIFGNLMPYKGEKSLFLNHPLNATRECRKSGKRVGGF